VDGKSGGGEVFSAHEPERSGIIVFTLLFIAPMFEKKDIDYK